MWLHYNEGFALIQSVADEEQVLKRFIPFYLYTSFAILRTCQARADMVGLSDYLNRFHFVKLSHPDFSFAPRHLTILLDLRFSSRKNPHF